MSQVKTLPITATRWLSLLLCAITAATITVFLSKVGFVQKAYLSWNAILNANPILHYSCAFLAGIGIKLLLDKFYISHTKRSIEFNWRYPPVTIAVLASYFLTAFYMLSTAPKFDEAALYAQSFMSLKYLALTFIGMLITVIYQAKLYTQKPIFTAVLVALSTMYVGLAYIAAAFYVFISLAASYLILAIYLLCNEYRQSKQQNFTSEIEPIETKESPELKTLEDFREWFKDDSTIKSTERLEPDLQVYVKRITERLQNGGDKYEKNLAQHIALCGPYGCGKSSIVESIVNDLAKNSAKDSTWIHSDISTWGAASGSVAHVVLSNIIDDISQYIDMCAFRALPKHYTEALKSGGSVFQFASTLLAGPVDIEGSFQKLNDVLDATNHKLLITLQDVDRGAGDENEKRLNDIAALLDRLKNRDLSHINFIVVMGNENEVAAEVISKATDYREDIFTIDLTERIFNYIKLSVESAISPHKNTAHKSYYIFGNSGLLEKRDGDIFTLRGNTPEFSKNNQDIRHLNEFITSLRIMKKILRRVDQVWQPKKLMGEVNFMSLLQAISLKEVNYSAFIKMKINRPKIIEEYEGKRIKSLIEKMSSNETGNIDDNLEQLLKHLFCTKPLLERYQWLIQKQRLNDPLTSEHEKKSILNNREEINLNMNRHTQQSLGCMTWNIDYLNRILLEQIPSNGELSDQVLIAKIIELRESQSIVVFLNEWLSLSEEYSQGVERFFFIPRCCKDSTKGLVKFFEADTPSSCILQFAEPGRNINENIDLAITWLIANNLDLENFYEVINKLLFIKDGRVNFDRLLKYLGYTHIVPVEYEDMLDQLNSNDLGKLILTYLMKSYQSYHSKQQFSDLTSQREFHYFGEQLSSFSIEAPTNSNVALINTSKLPAYENLNVV
ncbi:P-loop NTPase fold protein [Pseudoalteromonas sp. TAB23]|uniref:P-loop NTPase fold protein n=1 Tax=Pseudoalteromonas sp. TAB23 TaxID=1938595 RepID=UPI0004036C7B|nr:P-loop NTPase fold protein [Pseudoalteromonas sp. TAB23]